MICNLNIPTRHCQWEMMDGADPESVLRDEKDTFFLKDRFDVLIDKIDREVLGRYLNLLIDMDKLHTFIIWRDR